MNSKSLNKAYPKRKKFCAGMVVAFSVAVIFLLGVGSTLAYFFAKTESTTNTFLPGKVECSVVETFNDNNTVKTSLAVKNDGNTSAFVRVCFTTYWVDTSGNVIGKNAVMPTFTLNTTDWCLGADGYYYHLKPVLAGQQTATMFASGSTIVLNTDTEGNKQVVEVLAQAIQSAPYDAVKNSWSSETGGSVTEVTNGALVVTPPSGS